jgi:hypothetical protein
MRPFSFLTLALLLAVAVGVVSQHTDAAARRQLATQFNCTGLRP